MKKLLTFFMTALLAFGIGWAAEVTITMSQQGWTNAEDVTGVSSGDVSIAFDAGTNTQNSPKYYDTGSGVRLYNGNTMTITASGKTITAIELTFSGTYLGGFSSDVGTYSVSGSIGTWAGSATAVTFTASSTCRLQKVKVTYTSSTPSLSATGVEILDYTNETKSGTFKVNASNLTGDLSLTTPSNWTITPTTIAYNATFPYDVTAEYTGKALGDVATINVTGNSADNVSATAQVTYTYAGSIYIVGDVNHKQWSFEDGVQMTRGSNGVYSAIVNTQAGGEGKTWFYFTKKMQDQATVVANAFGPESNGNWGLTTELFGEPCNLDKNGNLNTIYMNPGCYRITVTPADNKFSITPYLYDPVITPSTGIYSEPQTVTISSGSENATIYYTLDGSDPTTSSSSIANGGTLTISSDCTLKVIAAAYYDGVPYTSNVISATYTFRDPSSTNIYVKVTDASQLVAGKKYIIVNEAYRVGMGDIVTINSNQVGSAVEGLTFEDNTVNIAETDVQEWTLSGNEQGWLFDDGEGNYLRWVSGNTLTKSNSSDNNSKWTVASKTVGGATGFALSNVATTTRTLYYNSGSPRFACYTSSQSLACLYVQEYSAPACAKPVITPASGEYYGEQEVRIECATEGATIYYTINGGEQQTYSGPFNVTLNDENTQVTIVAWAVKGDLTSAQETVTYTLMEGGVSSIAEFLALENGTETFFKTPVTVLFDYSQASSGGQEYIWVKDRTGFILIYVSPAFDNTNHVPLYENGDVIPPGFKVKKGYYSTGRYNQGQCFNDQSTFKPATEKALADPEQVTLSELLANPYKYNNRYLYINKLEVTEKDGLDFHIAADENGDGISEIDGDIAVVADTTIVGYNKYNSPAWKNKQGDEVGVELPATGVYQNVTFIFQQWQGTYEIMPITFTPWVDNSLRLEDLVKEGVENDNYTISNQLIAAAVTWDDNRQKFAIFAKDDEQYAQKRYPTANQENYLIEYENESGDFINTVEQKDYDQSNWIEILIPSEIATKSEPNAYLRKLGELKEQFENQILKARTISGTYVDALNPTIEMSTLPIVENSSTYTPNIFCTGNFLMENLDADGATSYREEEEGVYYFFMDAKPHEFCKVVWAFYEGQQNGGNYFVAPAQEGYDINGHNFHGSFKANMALCEDEGIFASTNVWECFDPSNQQPKDVLYGFKAIVRKNPDYWTTTPSGAPRRIVASDSPKEDPAAYIVYPLNAGTNSTDNVTGVNEVVVNKTVKSVRYYNLMGIESSKPFEGINIVVTSYSDGSISTVKVLR